MTSGAMEPRTETGRRLAADPYFMNPYGPPTIETAILAIESEARLAALDEVEAAVKGEPSYGTMDNWVPDGFGGTEHEDVDVVSRPAVLAAISSLCSKEPTDV